jgi:hypothetical protein
VVKAGAMQEHDGRQGAVELAAAGRDEYLGAIHIQLHRSNPLRTAERLAEIVDDIA